MNTINETYINALLADASYVRLQQGADDAPVGQPLKPVSGQNAALAARLTQPQADFITNNFVVLDQELSPTGGFDAVVWKGQENTPYAGKVYVSIRGTQGSQDSVDDIDLASAGVPYRQMVSMVNWWIKATTLPGQQAQQIKTDADNNFIAASSVNGSGLLATVGSIESVNAHSLGGYLATAFTNLFGAQWGVKSVNTFNSAGFNRLRANDKIQTAFNQISVLIGPSRGLGSLDAVGALQNNYYAENGINVTTEWHKSRDINSKISQPPHMNQSLIDTSSSIMSVIPQE